MSNTSYTPDTRSRSSVVVKYKELCHLDYAGYEDTNRNFFKKWDSSELANQICTITPNLAQSEELYGIRIIQNIIKLWAINLIPDRKGDYHLICD